MKGISGNRKNVVSHIDLFPPLSSFHVVIINTHVVWVTIVGNEFNQSATDLDISGHEIYSYFFGSTPKKNLGTGLSPYTFYRRKEGISAELLFDYRSVNLHMTRTKVATQGQMQCICCKLGHMLEFLLDHLYIKRSKLEMYYLESINFCLEEIGETWK